MTTLLLHTVLAAWTLPGPQNLDELVGKKAPRFTLPRLTEGEISLADLRGHPVVLVFGATKDAAPLSLEWMTALQEKLGDTPVHLFQIAILDNPWYIPEFAARGMLEDFVPPHGRPLVLIEWGKGVAQAYGIPRDDLVRVVVVDARGKVRWHHTGEREDNVLAALMKRLVEGS